MIHQYKNNGYNIVMDVCSGAIHVVDDVTYDVIALYEEKSLEEIENESLPCIFISVLPILIIFISNFTLSKIYYPNIDGRWRLNIL